MCLKLKVQYIGEKGLNVLAKPCSNKALNYKEKVKATLRNESPQLP